MEELMVILFSVITHVGYKSEEKRGRVVHNSKWPRKAPLACGRRDGNETVSEPLELEPQEVAGVDTHYLSVRISPWRYVAC